jgi:hypothetical protein
MTTLRIADRTFDLPDDVHVVITRDEDGQPVVHVEDGALVDEPTWSAPEVDAIFSALTSRNELIDDAFASGERGYDPATERRLKLAGAVSDFIYTQVPDEVIETAVEALQRYGKVVLSLVLDKDTYDEALDEL